MQGAFFNLERDAVIGMHRPVALVDVLQQQAHELQARDW